MAKLDPETLQFERYYLRSESEYINPLRLPERAGTFWSIAEDSIGTLWVGTNSAGVIRLAPDRKSWSAHGHDPNDRHTIASNRVQSILVDRNSQIWVGGVSGLNRYNPLANTVDYVPQPIEWSGTDGIESLYPLDDGRVVAAVIGKGLWLVDPQTSAWSKIPGPTGWSYIDANRIWAAPDGSFWVGLSAEPNLIRLDSKLSRFDVFEMPGRVTAYFGDRQGYQWFGLLGIGLARLDPATKRIVTWEPDPKSPHALGHAFVFDIFEDSKSRFWVAHNDGLDLMDREHGRFTHYLPDPTNPRALAGGNVQRIVEDPNNDLWVHSNVAGISHFDPSSGNFTNFPLVASPVDTSVGTSQFAISHGKLWWGASRGIVSFDFKQRSYQLYGLEQGITELPSDIAALPDGRLALSFTDRIGLFDPSRLLTDKTVPTPVVTRIKLGPHEVLRFNNASDFQIDGAPAVATELTVPYDHPPLTIEFSALHFTGPATNEYAFKLEGLEAEWAETDASNRRTTYTTLPPGRYSFLVKAANPSGIWGEDATPLTLTVLPPWWRTWWAYVLYAVAAVLLVTSLIWLRTRALRARAIALESQVYARTKELSEQKALVDSQAKHLEMLVETKDRLMTRISHEFRTPLTVILGPIDRMHAEATTERLSTFLAVAKRNASRLLRLVDQLLGLARLSSGHSEVTRPVSAAPVIRQVIASFESLAVERDLDLRIEQLDPLTLQTTEDALEKIVVNLVSNAIKYSSDGGSIRVSLVTDPLQRGVLTVSDTGRGISADRLPHIFEPFERGDEDSERIPGSGIGLALVHELVTAHAGQIEVVSVPQRGSVFRIQIPLATVDAPATQPQVITSKAARLEVDSIRSDTSPPGIVAPSVHNESLLVIEDNLDMREYLRSVLEDAYRLEFAVDGNSGLERAIDLVPDLVVCDIMLPEKNGYEVCHALKSDDRTSHIPVILLTALEDQEHRMKGLQEKADDYLTKPFNESELRQRIANLLEVRSLLQRRFSRDLRYDRVPPADIGQRDQHFLQELSRLVDKRHGDPHLDNAKIAGELAVSERNLQRKVKALVGLKLGEYLRSYRLQKAMERLLAGERPGEVAFAVGFTSQAYFSTCFRLQFGYSPSEARERARGK